MQVIAGTRALRLIQAGARGRWQVGKDNFVGVWDEQVCCPSIEEMATMAEGYYQRFPSSGRDEAYDCEDISMAFSGCVRAEAAQAGTVQHSIACGLIMGRFSWVHSFGELHVCCWVLIDEGADVRLYLLEPQHPPQAESLSTWLRPFSEARELRFVFG